MSYRRQVFGVGLLSVFAGVIVASYACDEPAPSKATEASGEPSVVTIVGRDVELVAVDSAHGVACYSQKYEHNLSCVVYAPKGAP